MLKAILTALQIPGALGKLADFFRWLRGKFLTAAAEKQHAENQAAIDAAFSADAPGVQHTLPGAENQPRPAPPGPPPVSGGEDSRA